MLLLLELEHVIGYTDASTNTACQTQLQKLIRYKWNNKYKHIGIERLNDTVGRMFMCNIQDVITKGKVGEMVNILCSMIRRAGREMEIQTTEFKEGDYCYHEQHKGKKRSWNGTERL